MASLLRHLSTLPPTIGKVTGQAVVTIVSAAPKVVSGALEAAAALPSTLGGIKLGPSVKAAFKVANVPFDPEVIGRKLGNITHSSLGTSLQSNLDSINDIFSALGIKVKIVSTTTTDARASVRVLTSRKGASEDSCSAPVGLTPRQFVQFFHEARRSGTIGASLERYIDHMTKEGRLRSIPMLPKAFQRKLYIDVARLMVFTFQQAFLTLDQAVVWGHKLEVSSSPSLPSSAFSQSRTKIGEAQLGAIVEKMLESQAVNIAIVPDFIEKRLYVNCMMVVFQLLDDFLTRDGEQVCLMGHALRFSLEPQALQALRYELEHFPVTLCTIDESILTELVDELLADDDMNIQWMPDMIESQVYKGVLRLMIRIIEEIASRLKMKILGRDIDVRILGAADVRASQEKTSKEGESEAFLYYAEEDPFKTISTTELEERLKDLDEQQKVLVALQQLGGAEFDLTAERPMLGAELDTSLGSSVGSDSGNTSSATTVDDEEVHEFQRLAHTLKLGRSLSINCEVNADIHVPYSMIADLKTYPDWMPWCTSGRDLSEKTADPKNSRVHFYKGEVAFGIETGSFLGTLGDNVQYQLKSVSPSIQDGAEVVEEEHSTDAEAVTSQHDAKHDTPTESSAEDSTDTTSNGAASDTFPAGYARVVADASDGFAYGEKLIYDWRFRRLGPGLTKVELDMLFQARSVLYMPFWDSMQNMVITKMLVAFKERAEFLQKHPQEQPGSSR